MPRADMAVSTAHGSTPSGAPMGKIGVARLAGSHVRRRVDNPYNGNLVAPGVHSDASVACVETARTSSGQSPALDEEEPGATCPSADLSGTGGPLGHDTPPEVLQRVVAVMGRGRSAGRTFD